MIKKVPMNLIEMQTTLLELAKIIAQPHSKSEWNEIEDKLDDILGSVQIYKKFSYRI